MGESMDKMEKKMAAALAAVSAYMQQEQEAYAEALTAAIEGPKAKAVELNQWGQSGRQGMMSMRNLMQIKAFNRFR
jgi:antitoxin component HigA of HigAB toxin-antitoxin module